MKIVHKMHEENHASLLNIKKDFPIFESSKKPFTYLDTASSAQKPRAVITSMTHAMENEYANIHRGLYKNAQVMTERYEGVRKTVAAFIGAPSAEEIIFTRSATESINLIANSWGRNTLKSGDEIILTTMEHHANIVPWQMAAEATGAALKIIPLKSDGTLDMDAYAGLLSPRTRLVGAVHISNALGILNPVGDMIRLARAYNPDIAVLIDGSQGVVHGPVDVCALGCDFYVFTGHKLYAPTGSGILWGRGDILATMPPWQGGGDMIERLTFEKTTYKPAPARFEAGTPDFLAVIGLGAAIDYLSSIGMAAIREHEAALLERAMGSLRGIDGLRFYGDVAGKAGIVSFTAAWGAPSDIAVILDQCNVAVRAGHHCCMPLMAALGLEGTVRVSFGLYTDTGDIDALEAGLAKARRILA